MENSDYAWCRREAKEGWLGLPVSKRKALEEKIATMDLDAVLRMKIAFKKRVVRGDFDSRDVKAYYDDMDVWIKEETLKIRNLPPEGDVLNPLEKAVLIKFAMDECSG